MDNQCREQAYNGEKHAVDQRILQDIGPRSLAFGGDHTAADRAQQSPDNYKHCLTRLFTRQLTRRSVLPG